MTDRELLERAANAAGNGATWSGEHECMFAPNGDGTATYWNPLTDAGDRARLEDALQMHVSHLANGVDTMSGSASGYAELSETNGDRTLAHNLAAVRCAAQIGERK